MATTGGSPLTSVIPTGTVTKEESYSGHYLPRKGFCSQEIYSEESGCPLTAVRIPHRIPAWLYVPRLFNARPMGRGSGLDMYEHRLPADKHLLPSDSEKGSLWGL